MIQERCEKFVQLVKQAQSAGSARLKETRKKHYQQLDKLKQKINIEIKVT